jgi:uncharacterized protein
VSRALVTGASSGIGASFARRLAADGFELVLVARRGDRLERAAEELGREHGVAADPVVADLTDPDDRRLVERILAREPAFDLLVNNAGFGRYGRFDEVDAETIEAMVAINVLAATSLARAALPGMVARGSGAIVNVASMLAFTSSIPPSPLPLRATYAASKAFVIALSELLAGELAGTGVRVQALCPGIVRTEFDSIAHSDPPQPPPSSRWSQTRSSRPPSPGWSWERSSACPGCRIPSCSGASRRPSERCSGRRLPGPARPATRADPPGTGAEPRSHRGSSPWRDR